MSVVTVISALIVYIKVVTVQKLIVKSWTELICLSKHYTDSVKPFLLKKFMPFIKCNGESELLS